MIIKFNLLPQKVEVERKIKRGVPFLKSYFILILMSFSVMAGLFYRNINIIKKYEKDKAELQLQINNYKTRLAKIKELERESLEIKKRIETILELKKAQGKKLYHLAEILKEVQPDRLIITNFNLKEDKAYIKGIGLDMDFLAHYMGALESKKEIIKNVNLKIATQKEAGEFKLVEFELEVQF